MVVYEISEHSYAPKNVVPAVLVEKFETSGKFTKMLLLPSLSLVSLSVSSTWLVKNASTSLPEKVFLADCEVFPKDAIF